MVATEVLDSMIAKWDRAPCEALFYVIYIYKSKEE